MTIKKSLFLSESKNVAFDESHRRTIAYNMGKYHSSVENGKKRYSDLKLCRDHASDLKRKVLKNLPAYLKEFEAAASGNGIEVLWAIDKNEVITFLNQIIEENNVKKVVKSKSMTSEEINFNEIFSHKGIDCIETDLGEFIVQNAGEKPYHILTPAMHKSRKDVAQLFNGLFGTDEDASASELTLFVRKNLRTEFETSDMALTGANFLVAREGGIALTENEGNGLFSIAYPRIHVVLAGIEKILPQMSDLGLFWPWLALHGTGQKITAYNSLIFGPSKNKEEGGPEKMIVILIDNNRSKLFNKPYQSEALACIRCGACLNACPVYHNIGGYTYNTIYSGPIGSVITPHLNDHKEYSHLSYACSLCGNCFESCPVSIDLPSLLLRNRKEAIDNGYQSASEKSVITIAYQILSKPSLIDKIGGQSKSFLLSLMSRSVLGKNRKLPKFEDQSFRQQYKRNTSG